MLESSTSLIFAGHSTFSAPSYLRTFFHNDFESMVEGNPEITIIRIARGSLGVEGCAGFDGRGVALSFLGVGSCELFSLRSL